MAQTSKLVGEQSTITTEDIRFKSALDEAKINRFGRNVNGLINEVDGYIGEMFWSDLTETQFQAQHGDGWVLCDGRNVDDSRIANELGINPLPDSRGRFLGGAEFQYELGQLEVEKAMSHTHPMATFRYETRCQTGSSYGDWAQSVKSSFSTVGGVETRPKNMALYLFIRIN